jgi:hypothetical protein
MKEESARIFQRVAPFFLQKIHLFPSSRPKVWKCPHIPNCRRLEIQLRFENEKEFMVEKEQGNMENLKNSVAQKASF